MDKIAWFSLLSFSSVIILRRTDRVEKKEIEEKNVVRSIAPFRRVRRKSNYAPYSFFGFVTPGGLM